MKLEDMPLHWNLELRHKDEEALIPVVKYLIHNIPTIGFSWEHVLLERSHEYVLTIEGAWANNLQAIVELLPIPKDD